MFIWMHSPRLALVSPRVCAPASRKPGAGKKYADKLASYVGVAWSYDVLEVDGQVVRLVVTEGKYRMVRRILANTGHPVTALHRVRYGEVRIDDYDVEEGDSVAVEGSALDWAVQLREAPAPQSLKAARSEGSTGTPSKARVRTPPARAPAERLDAEAAMEAAWMPRASDVSLVMEEAGVGREEAVEALRRSRGDIVKALLEL